MTDRPWKLVLLLTGIFLAGALTGGVASRQFFRPRGQATVVPEQWGPNRLQLLSRRLGLTPAQIEKLRPLIKRDMDDLNRIRQGSWRDGRRILERMEADIAAELTPEQKVKFEQLSREIRERNERLPRFNRPGSGPGLRDRPPRDVRPPSGEPPGRDALP